MKTGCPTCLQTPIPRYEQQEFLVTSVTVRIDCDCMMMMYSIRPYPPTKMHSHNIYMQIPTDPHTLPIKEQQLTVEYNKYTTVRSTETIGLYDIVLYSKNIAEREIKNMTRVIWLFEMQAQTTAHSQADRVKADSSCKVKNNFLYKCSLTACG